MSQSDVIVIGGGPSGVAAAISLRKAGIAKVTVLERESYLGGATRYCSHSPFGMLEFGRVHFGAAYGRRLEDEASRWGIDVRYGHSVVELRDKGHLLISNHNGLETLEAKRIVVSTGARETTRAARLITGDRPVGVLTTGTLQSYVAFHGMMPFKRPIIVGSELVTLSAVLTCLNHGARPVAVIESRKEKIAPAPLNWFPSMMGIPFHCGAELVDILGRGRVEAVRVQRGETFETLECDGVLFSGGFTPESSLFMTSGLSMDWGSSGPAVDQAGRCDNPYYFAAGNVLRAVETGGWAFREGRAVGESVAADLKTEVFSERPIKVTHDEPIKLVVPNLIRGGPDLPGGLKEFQLRFKRITRGRLTLLIDGDQEWSKHGTWRPERRIIVPRPRTIHCARTVHFTFRQER